MGKTLYYNSLPSFHLGWLSEDVTITDDLNTDLITDLSCNTSITMEENTFQTQREKCFYELFYYILGVNACHRRMKHPCSEEPLPATLYSLPVHPSYICSTDNIIRRRQVRFL